MLTRRTNIVNFSEATSSSCQNLADRGVECWKKSKRRAEDEEIPSHSNAVLEEEESDYKRLMDVYEEMAYLPSQECMSKLMASFRQLSISQILQLESRQRQNKNRSFRKLECAKSYSLSMRILEDQHCEVTLLTLGGLNYFAIEVREDSNGPYLIEADPTAVEIYKGRPDFIEKLRGRSSSFSSAPLTEITSELLLLYREYTIRRKHALAKLQGQQEPPRQQYIGLMRQLKKEASEVKRKKSGI